MATVAVIGGGAAGLAAAIAAARAGAQVKVFEASNRVGHTILQTGNGRCNLTNAGIAPAKYNAPDFVAPVLAEYGFTEIRDWFDGLGLMTYEEREGRVYPISNAANSVLDTLRLSCNRLGVRFITNSKVNDVEGVKADAVVVATGGGSRVLASAGHETAPFQPVLCSLRTEIDPIRGLSGIRVPAEVSALKGSGNGKTFARERGEVLFRDYGVSGIVIFNMSRVVEKDDWLNLDLLPDKAVDEVTALLVHRLENARLDAGDAPVTYEDLLCGMFHTRVNLAVLRLAKCKPSAPVGPGQLGDVAGFMKNIRLHVLGVGDAKRAQVTRGGALLDEFDAATLESKLRPGLFAAGEALDVDAPCGGYNLHWAWASGLVAGRNAAEHVLG